MADGIFENRADLFIVRHTTAEHRHRLNRTEQLHSRLNIALNLLPGDGTSNTHLAGVMGNFGSGGCYTHCGKVIWEG